MNSIFISVPHYLLLVYRKVIDSCIMGLLSKIITVIVSRSFHAFPRWTVSLRGNVSTVFVFFSWTLLLLITLVFDHTFKILLFILLGKKDKLRVYYLSWLRNKILHNDPEVEKKQGWTTVGDLEGCVHYKVGECSGGPCSALQSSIRVRFKLLGCMKLVRCPVTSRSLPSFTFPACRYCMLGGPSQSLGEHLSL